MRKRSDGIAADVDRRLLLATDRVRVRDNVCARLDPALSAPTHPMACFEIVFPLSGLWIRQLNGLDLAVEPNSIHFVAEGEVHRVRHPAGCGDRNTGISLSSLLLEEIALSGEGPLLDWSRRTFRINHRPAHEKELASHLMLRRALADPLADTLALEEAALLLTSRVLAGGRLSGSVQMQDSATARAHHDLVLCVIEVLERRFADSPTLAEISREASTSPFHMARVFRAGTGSSVHGWIRRRRVAAAVQLLLETELTLSSIADHVGFADAPHLCRTVRRVLGATPRALRTLEWREALHRMEQQSRASGSIEHVGSTDALRCALRR